jgi:hypothetical protein
MPAAQASLRLAVLAAAAFASFHADAQHRLSNSADLETYLASVVRDTKIPGVVGLVVDADGIL